MELEKYLSIKEYLLERGFKVETLKKYLVGVDRCKFRDELGEWKEVECVSLGMFRLRTAKERREFKE